MTRKDYRLIAGAIAECSRPVKYLEQLHIAKYIAENIACYLKKDNARFNKEQFMKACGLGEGTDNE